MCTVGSGSNSGFWLCGGHPNVIHTPTQTETTGDWTVQACNEKRVRTNGRERDGMRKGVGEEEKKWSLGEKKVMRLEADERNSEKKHNSGLDEREGETVEASREEKKAVRMCIKQI